MQRQYPHLGWLASVSAGLAICLVAVTAPLAEAPHETDPRVPWIETLAADAFDPRITATAEFGVSYRVNATVLLPVLVTSIPLVHRDDVGVASFSARVFGDDGPLWAYEFFAASFPERARGLNRLGLMREVLQGGRSGVDWTAQFGLMTVNDETSRAAAEAVLDDDGVLPQRYTVANSFISPAESQHDLIEVELAGRWTSAASMYREALSAWRWQQPEQTVGLDNTDLRRYRNPFGFLGGLQRMLKIAAADVARGASPRRFRYPYVHNGGLFFLELRSHALDSGWQSRLEEAGVALAEPVVHRLDYAILDHDGGTVERFTLWTELPTSPGPLGAPIIPVGFEFSARSYLRLQAVQVAPGANTLTLQ